MYLRNFIAPDHGDWVDILPEAEFCYNTAHATSIGMSPFKARHGFDALKPMDLVLARNEDATSNYFSKEAAELAHQREFIQARAKENLEKAQRKYNKAANKKRREVVLKEGDKAWLKTKNLTIPNTLAYKWMPKWAGPYEVLKVLYKDVYLIDAPKKGRFHRVFHISKLKKFIKDIRVNFDSPEGPIRVKTGRVGLHLIGSRVRSLPYGQLNRRGYARMESRSQALMWWTTWRMGPKENVKPIMSIVCHLSECEKFYINLSRIWHLFILSIDCQHAFQKVQERCPYAPKR
jgi:hypothetical protein